MHKIIMMLAMLGVLGGCASWQIFESAEQQEARRVAECQAHIESSLSLSSGTYKFQDVYDAMQEFSYNEFLKKAKSREGRIGKCVLSPAVDENNLRTAYAVSLEISSYFKELKSAVDNMQGRMFYGCQDVAAQEYQKIFKRYQKIEKMGKDIYYWAQDKEEKDFHSKTGFYLDLYDWYGNNTLTSYMINSYSFRPEKEYLYDLKRLEVFQRVPGGYLLRADISGYPSEIIFIKTNRFFPVGSQFDSNQVFVTLTGKQRYTTLLGEDKEVFAFRIVDIKPFQKWLKSYLFYPQAVRTDIAFDPNLVKCN